HQALLESPYSLLPIRIPQLRQLVEGPPRPGRPGADGAFDQHGSVMGPGTLLEEAFRRAFFNQLEDRATIVSHRHGSGTPGRQKAAGNTSLANATGRYHATGRPCNTSMRRK